MQNAAWSRMVSEDWLHFLYFRKCVTTHSTIDNNHRRQETLLASDTTRHQQHNFSSFIYRRKAKFTSKWRTRWAKHFEHWFTVIRYRKTQRSCLISQDSNAVWYWSSRTSIKEEYCSVSMRCTEWRRLAVAWILNILQKASIQCEIPVDTRRRLNVADVV